MNPVSRRGLLLGLSAACALTVLPVPVRASSADVTQTLLSFVGDRRSAATLGQSWIDADASRASPTDVVNRLEDTLHAEGWSGSNDPAELRQRFNAAVRADFKNGETVTIEGWQLARTQADLCALAYFATQGVL